ncbi:TPA: hypothetical protein DCQ44_03145, partial [Candidatus Taylorbacteria bacterium]|nr:hypothetical protein [Candidatus Taylorbacteria bacterium]
MNRKHLIFFGFGLMWCFGLSLFFLNQKGINAPILERAVSFAEAIVPVAVKKPVTILAFGDMMLDRKVREQIVAQGPEYPFALIKDFLKGNDIVVANAEGPFTDRPSVTMGVKDGPLNFTFDPAMLPILKNLGFTLFSQANNHAMNFGLASYQQSISHIEEEGLGWFGDPRNIDVAPYFQKVRGEKVAFIGYHEFAHRGLDNVLETIKNAKKEATFIVVYPHWGDEYQLEANDLQRETGHAFIDAGADVVIGAHPHVIEPIEMYKNKVIFYSLGNFIFDQQANA